LPWNERTAEHLDLTKAQDILEADHYALGDVKDRVLEFLAVRQLRAEADKADKADGADKTEPGGQGGHASGWGGRGQGASAAERPRPAGNDDDKAKGPILLFVGPPGVGKTSVAKSIARAMGREYVRISLGGARDEADIRGHRRTYVGAMPGRIIQGLKQAGSRNPVFLLDEVDKLGVSFQGDPASALLEVLDPAQNDSFTDHYLGVPFDLSEVLFIATANFLQNIPGPLLDRMEVVEFSGYTEGEKHMIARKYLIPRQFDENGVTPAQLEITDPALHEVIGGYTRESGVRQLERELGKLARKVARKLAAKETERVVVDITTVKELLGRPKVHPEKAMLQDQVGVATGMYYTSVGGDIMFVEASTMKGKGELVLTGQLGDVMKESARAAWTYARSHAAGLRIADDAFERDLHIHVPAGAIPKDGPSAGVTMATALVSALSGRPARHDIAMTGEITLRGGVLPIGGLKEKILGAVRAGITTLVIPKENEPDLEDLPEEVRRPAFDGKGQREHLGKGQFGGAPAKVRDRLQLPLDHDGVGVHLLELGRVLPGEAARVLDHPGMPALLHGELEEEAGGWSVAGELLAQVLVDIGHPELELLERAQQREDVHASSPPVGPVSPGRGNHTRRIASDPGNSWPGHKGWSVRTDLPSWSADDRETAHGPGVAAPRGERERACENRRGDARVGAAGPSLGRAPRCPDPGRAGVANRRHQLAGPSHRP
jgi:DNA polymerase III delta prime subunit